MNLRKNVSQLTLFLSNLNYLIISCFKLRCNLGYSGPGCRLEEKSVLDATLCFIWEYPLMKNNVQSCKAKSISMQLSFDALYENVYLIIYFLLMLDIQRAKRMIYKHLHNGGVHKKVDIFHYFCPLKAIKNHFLFV